MAVKKTKDVESISIHALTKRATNGELVVDVQRLISIHALTKRATITMFPSLIKGDIISIHALTKRATGSAGRVKWGGLYFNPRSHEESDAMTLKGTEVINDFNPRSHEESDLFKTNHIL